jgi:amidase
MKRREFLQTSAMACAVAIANPILSKFNVAAEEQASAVSSSFELEEATFGQLQEAMQSGRLTAKSITEAYLARIEQIDKKGPAINSVIEINPDALSIAEGLDAERKQKGPRSALHGVPILVKDNIDTADKMMTTAGSLALLGSIAQQDAFVTKQLRDAGAVIVGKTNLSEWANFRSSHSSSGWSGRGGQTKNPYILNRNPCGSSSGSGAAAAANLCAGAIGTETDGSVVCPSSANSLVGIKPTLGLIGRSGIIPIAHSQDTAGPMTRTVTDAAILLSILSGYDPRDKSTAALQGKPQTDYTKFLDKDGLRSARIGVVRKSFEFNDHVDQLMNDLIKELKALGAVIVDPAEIPTSDDFGDSEFQVLLYEFKADLNAYLSGLGPDAPVHSLKELIEFNENNRDKEMPYFGQDIFTKAEAKGPLTSKEYLKALKHNHEMTQKKGIDLVMSQKKLDALIAPTGGPAWITDWINGDCYSGGYSSASAVAGYPHITVPAGFVFGLPVGISFFGTAHSEAKLIRFAYAFEQATKARKTPQFLATANLDKSCAETCAESNPIPG